MTDDDGYTLVTSKQKIYIKPPFVSQTRKTGEFKCFCNDCKESKEDIHHEKYSTLSKVYEHLEKTRLGNLITTCRRCKKYNKKEVVFVNIQSIRKHHFDTFHKQYYDDKDQPNVDNHDSQIVPPNNVYEILDEDN
jgi:hypothetical protein